MAIRPLILVQTNPQTVSKDSNLIISARFYNRDTLEKMPVRNIYMNIISAQEGNTVWPIEVIRHDTWKLDIEISTKEMESNTNYLVRISNNSNLSPQGSTEFKIKKTTNLTVVPVLLSPTVIVDTITDVKQKIIKKTKENELTDSIDPLETFQVNDIDKPIEKKVFITQMDSRVCPKCIDASNGSSPGLRISEYYPDDPDMPDIPVHFNCRCTYDIIFEKEFEASFDDVAQVWQAAQLIPVINVISKI